MKKGNEESSHGRWKKWMPMDPYLFHGLQTLHLCMLQKIDEMLTKANVEYWICGGTLIGAIRHSGFIPHDDDIDIEVKVSDLAALAEIPTDPPFYTGFVRDASRWEGHKVSHFQFFHGEFEVDVFQRSDDLVDEQKHFPSKKEIYPLERYEFHNIKVSGPCRKTCGSYLDRLYGEDWRKTVCVWNHDFNYYHTKAFDGRKEVLDLSDYNNIIKEAEIKSPVAEEAAEKTFLNFSNQFGEEEFLSKYKKYRSQRTFRWNRADAEWRFEQQERNQQALKA